MLTVEDIDEMYTLSKSIKEQEKRLAELKQKAVEEYRVDGVDEMMGTRGKIIISKRELVVYDPLKVFRRCDHKAATFLPMVKVSNTAMQKMFGRAEDCIQSTSTSIVVAVK